MRRFDPTRWLALLTTTACGVLAGAWLWRCLCLFPTHGWNEIRLAPSFMWRHGLSPYPPSGAGPATTWIYGPLPLLLQLPATFAHDSAGALVSAGIINIVVILVAITAVCLFWPAPFTADAGVSRLTALLACVALWPATSLEFMQPDNAAVAFGLLALLCLQKSRSPGALWLAAAGCAAAISCKQTLLGLALAECVYLAWRGGVRAGVMQGLRIVVLTAAILGLAAFLFGTDGFAFHLFTLPASLPWAASFSARLSEFTPYLLVQAGVPLFVIALLGSRVWQKDSPWLLPALAWVAAWPLDLVALFKTGGSINSLHGWLFFLPPAAILLTASARLPKACRTVVTVLAAAALIVRLATTAPGTWRPLTQHLHQGEFLAHSLPGEVYFPWHPLVTFYAEGRFDHVEDGLFMLYLAGRPMAGPAATAHLPPKMHVVAFLHRELDWGIARTLIPPGAQQSTFRAWDLSSWALPGP
jgi:hypothetical protein